MLFTSLLPQKNSDNFLKNINKSEKNCIPIIQKFENISDIKFFFKKI